MAFGAIELERQLSSEVQQSDERLSVDVESHELLQRRVAVLEGIARGEMAATDGRVVSHAEAKARMARWLK